MTELCIVYKREMYIVTEPAKTGHVGTNYTVTQQVISLYWSKLFAFCNLCYILCAHMPVFASHICDCLWENQPILQYREMPVLNIQSVVASQC